MGREELDALEATARTASGLTDEEAPRVSCRRGTDGETDFHFFGPPPGSALLSHVVVDSNGNATVEQ
jgi:hypothetical protein|tara:strand:+ start:8407 stop:8607 length:201 start_codon:yes stop_codon:yes gene_type:complete